MWLDFAIIYNLLAILDKYFNVYHGFMEAAFSHDDEDKEAIP